MIEPLHSPPALIETERLLLRARRPDEAPELKDLIDRNLEHLRRWMRWAMDEPSSLEVIRARLELFASKFAANVEWGYGIYLRDGGALIGGLGLHRRDEPDVLEIGYWIDEAHTRRGFATEAARALTEIALRMRGVAHVEIRCDPNNELSAAVPRRLGYAHIATLQADSITPSGEPRDTMVWRRSTPAVS